MADPAALRAADFRALFQLVGECRELGDDALAWRRHLFAGVAGLTGAGVAMGGEMAGVRAGAVTSIGVADWGWEAGFDRAGWERAMGELARDPGLSRTPGLALYAARVATDDGVALARSDLLPDAEWYRSWDYENLHRIVGVDHTVWCLRSIAGTADEFSGLLASRPSNDRDFSERDKALVQEANALVGALVGGPLARFADPSPAALPPRARQVLRCFLEGDSDKQVAARLGMATLTVNQHAKRIYAHFGVQSRAELLARWVRRSWPIGPWS